MKATGIVRRIDDLGRVVIPKEIRRTMRIREGDPLKSTPTMTERSFSKNIPPLEKWGKRRTGGRNHAPAGRLSGGGIRPRPRGFCFRRSQKGMERAPGFAGAGRPDGKSAAVFCRSRAAGVSAGRRHGKICYGLHADYHRRRCHRSSGVSGN